MQPGRHWPDGLLRQPARRHRDDRRQADPRHATRWWPRSRPATGGASTTAGDVIVDPRRAGRPGLGPQRQPERRATAIPTPFSRRLLPHGGRARTGQHPGADGRRRDAETSTRRRRTTGAVLECHEPRPLAPGRASRSFPRGRTWHSRPAAWCWPTCTRAGHGRASERGEIKKLLVLEALPKPVNFSGGDGADQLSAARSRWNGSWARCPSSPTARPTSRCRRCGAVLRGPGRARPVGQADAELRHVDARRDDQLASAATSSGPSTPRPDRDGDAGRDARGPAGSSRSPACRTCSTSRATSSRSSTGTASSATTTSAATAAWTLSGDRGADVLDQPTDAPDARAWSPTAGTPAATAPRGRSAARPAA